MPTHTVAAIAMVLIKAPVLCLGYILPLWGHFIRKEPTNHLDKTLTDYVNLYDLLIFQARLLIICHQ